MEADEVFDRRVKHAKTPGGLWLKCAWDLRRGVVSMWHQQRLLFRGDRIVVLDQHGDPSSETRMTPAFKAPAEFIEVEPALRLDDRDFIGFAGREFVKMVEAIQTHWLGLAKLGYGDDLEELAENCVRPWEGRFMADDITYDVVQGVGAFADLDGMIFEFRDWTDERIEGALTVPNEPKKFAFEAEANSGFYRDFLLSTLPNLHPTAE